MFFVMVLIINLLCSVRSWLVLYLHSSVLVQTVRTAHFQCLVVQMLKLVCLILCIAQETVVTDSRNSYD